MRVWLVLCVFLAGCAANSPEPAGEEPDETEPADAGHPRSFGGTGVSLDELNQTEWSDSYTGLGLGPWALNTGCDPPLWEPGGPQYGGACLRLPTDAALVEFTLSDDVSPDVGVYVRTPSDGYGFFCSGGSFSPQGEEWVMFVTEDTGTCLLGGSPGMPTTGTITATIWHP